MHTEHFFLPEATARAINEAGRVIAVGTTSVRVLEHVATAEGLPLRECSGSTNIFIYPPYKYKVVDALITNFHLPQSTLLMLVSAFAGKELGHESLPGSHPGTVQVFFLRGLHADSVGFRRPFLPSGGRSAGCLQRLPHGSCSGLRGDEDGAPSGEASGCCSFLSSSRVFPWSLICWRAVRKCSVSPSSMFMTLA